MYVTCHKNIAPSDLLEQRNGDKNAKVVVGLNTLYARLSHQQLSFILSSCIIAHQRTQSAGCGDISSDDAANNFINHMKMSPYRQSA